MAGRFGLVVAVCVAACGRVGFDALDGAGSDAAGDSARDTPAPGFCASMPTATFCRDFDEGNGSSDWQFSSEFLGSLQFDSSEARSSPASLRVDTGTVAAGSSADVSLQQSSIGVATHATASFAILIDTPGTGDAVLFDITMDDGTHQHGLEVVTRAPPQIGYIEDIDRPSGGGSATIVGHPTAELSIGTWHDVALDYQSGSAAHVTVTYDGTTVLDIPPDFTTGGDASVISGILYLSGPATPWEVHIDNIAVTTQ